MGMIGKRSLLDSGMPHMPVLCLFLIDFLSEVTAFGLFRSGY